MSDEEARPEDNSESEDKDSFSQFIHDNLNMDGMPDAPNNSTKAKDDENNIPPTNPFTSRFGKPPTGGFSRFGSTKSDADNFDDSDDDDDPFTGSTGVFGKKSPFSGDNKDHPTPFGSSGSRFGGSGGSSGNSGNRFGGGNSENNPFGRFSGGDKNPPPPPSPFSALGRLSTNKQPPSSFGRKLTPPKTKEQKRVELIRNMAQLFKDLLPSILLLLLLIYFITVFSQYQPDVLKGDIQELQATIQQQEEQIRQLQSQLESISRER